MIVTACPVCCAAVGYESASAQGPTPMKVSNIAFVTRIIDLLRLSTFTLSSRAVCMISRMPNYLLSFKVIANGQGGRLGPAHRTQAQAAGPACILYRGSVRKHGQGCRTFR